MSDRRNRNALGRRLRRLREHEGLSRGELAARTGLSDRSIVRLERGDNVFMSTYLAVRAYFQPESLSEDLFEAVMLLSDEEFEAVFEGHPR